MFFSGSSDSPAAIPISSVPWKEKPTIIATPIIAAKPPANGASPICQLLQPAGCAPLKMPTIIATPTMIKMITVATLISENQYSASPKPRTEM
ncbi:hypothetical protein D3C87_1915600 [compost metagenome]